MIHITGRKAKAKFLAITGIKTMLDPKASRLKKSVAAAKLTCCGGYFGASKIIEGPSPLQVKALAATCCGAAWLGLGYLEWIDNKATLSGLRSN